MTQVYQFRTCICILMTHKLHAPLTAHMLVSMFVVGTLVTLIRAVMTVHLPLLEFEQNGAYLIINSKEKAVDQFYIS